jgi:hypothetical protein
VFAAVSLSKAQLTYSKLDVPGAVATEARGINNFGEIVGFYKTVACTDYEIEVPDCIVKGFKYVKGVYTKLMVPNSVSTAITGVNDLGDFVGFYVKSDGSLHGFIWYRQNVVKTIDFSNSPVAGAPTIPFGINKAGVVVGGLWSPGAQYPYYGWKWVNGKFSLMNPSQPGYPPPAACCWSVNAIANNGMMVGQGFSFDFNQSWFKQGSDLDYFMDTPPGNNGNDTFVRGVNSSADIVGFDRRGWLAKKIEAGEGTGDAGEAKPAFTTVSFPGSQWTVPFAINDVRGIVGTYLDSTGKQHGFLAK